MVLLVCPGWPPDVSLCWTHGFLFVVGAMCSHVYYLPLPSCYLIIVSVAPPVSPSLPSFISQSSLLVSAVLCWSIVFRRASNVDCTAVLCLPACFSPLGWFLFILFYFIIKKTRYPAFKSSPHLSLITHPDSMAEVESKELHLLALL